VRADPEQYPHRAECDHDDRGDEEREETRPLHGDPEDRLDALAEGPALPVLVREGLHRADLVQRLVHVARHVRHAILHRARQAPHAAAEDGDRQQRHGHPDQGEDRKLHAREEEHHHAAHERDRHPQRVEQRASHHRLDQRHVVGDARADFARARVLVERGREREEVIVDAAPQVRREARSDPVHGVDADPGEHPQDRDEAGKHREGAVEHRRLAAREPSSITNLRPWPITSTMPAESAIATIASAMRAR
jgi:hypothetical protein